MQDGNYGNELGNDAFIWETWQLSIGENVREKMDVGFYGILKSFGLIFLNY